MTSEELADRTEAFILAGRARIIGTGRDQYEKAGRQRFEDLTLDELLSECQDELVDVGNYASMLWMRIQKIRDLLASELGDHLPDDGSGT